MITMRSAVSPLVTGFTSLVLAVSARQKNLCVSTSHQTEHHVGRVTNSGMAQQLYVGSKPS